MKDVLLLWWDFVSFRIASAREASQQAAKKELDCFVASAPRNDGLTVFR
jgi:hypothetical protein